MEYEGTFNYQDEDGYIDVLSFKLMGQSVAFNMYSCPPNLGMWNIQGAADRTPNGSYTVRGIHTTQGGVSGPPVELTFRLSEFKDKPSLHVDGTWYDSDGFTRFAGVLDPKDS
jgi:hypothetical protein